MESEIDTLAKGTEAISSVKGPRRSRAPVLDGSMQFVTFQEELMPGCSKCEDIAESSGSRSAQIVLPVEYEVSVEQGNLEGCDNLIAATGARTHGTGAKHVMWGHAASVACGQCRENRGGRTEMGVRLLTMMVGQEFYPRHQGHEL
jgi:hypothetical protein